MIHLDLTTKRAKLALRFFTYGVMTLATIVLTGLVIFYAMGWRFNQKDLSFEQGGLVQFRSSPSGAQIVIDNALQNFSTPGRANLNSGSHAFKIQLSGYHDWQKNVDLGPGQLLWLNYARLIPNDISTTNAASFGAITGALASPDHRYILVHDSATSPNFELVDINDPNKVTFTHLNIPEAQLTKKSDAYGTFTIKEWDSSSRYILVEHVNGDTTEFIRLDRQNPDAAVNVSRVFSMNITAAHFSGSNSNVLFVKTGTTLRSLDLGNNSASAALVDSIEQFTVYTDGTVAFAAVSSDGTQRVVGLYQQGKQTVVKTYPISTPATVEYAEYVHHAYLVINNGSGTATILRDPITNAADTTEFAQVPLGKQIKWMKFSGNGRSLVVGNGSDMATYDIELGKFNKWSLAGAATDQPLKWLDDYYLWSEAGGTLKIVEFDGANGHDIATGTSGLGAILSTDNKYIYSFAKDGESYNLRKSQIVRN